MRPPSISLLPLWHFPPKWVIFAERTRKHELQDIIRGNGSVVQGAIIQAATAYLGREAPTNSRGEGEKQIRIQEVVALTTYIEENRLWFASPDGSSKDSGRFQEDFHDQSVLNTMKYCASWKPGVKIL